MVGDDNKISTMKCLKNVLQIARFICNVFFSDVPSINE